MAKIQYAIHGTNPLIFLYLSTLQITKTAFYVNYTYTEIYMKVHFRK